MLDTFLNLLVQGVLIGGLYALFALGLSLSLGVMRFVNIAHGDLIVLFSSVLLSVVGGIGSLEGPIIGAIVFFLLREWLADFGAWYLIVLGVVSVAVILFEPAGIWGACRRRGVPDLLPVSHAPEPVAAREPSGAAV